MTDKTPKLALPYLTPNQAQKHITVNENLRQLDALTQASVLAQDATTPPASPKEGDCYLLGPTPTGSWAGQDGKFAAYQDGAWNFTTPQAGWQIWNSATKQMLAYGTQAQAPFVFAPIQRVEIFHTITADASNDTGYKIPARCLVLGAATKTLETLSNRWHLGLSTQPQLFGKSLASHYGTTSATSSMTFTNTEEPLYISAVSGRFRAIGKVKIVLYYLHIAL